MNTHQLQHTTIPLKDHQNRFILSFSPKTSFVSKIFRTFANAISPLWFWGPNRRDEPLGRALHIERRYWRFVFGYLNVGTSNYQSKTNADVSSRGVIYTLRSVRRGLTMSSLAHFTGVYILLRGCLHCLFTCYGCGRPRTANRQKLSTHVFSFVVNYVWYSFALGAGG